MNNLMTKIVIAAVALVALAAGTIYLQFKIGMNRDIELPKKTLDELPMQFGSWKGEIQPIDEEIFKAIEGCEATDRTYTNPTGESATLHAAVFDTLWLSVPHPPLVCYPSAGWITQTTKEVELKGPDGQPATVRVITFDKHGRRTMVMHWYQSGDAVFYDDAGLLRSKKRYRTRKTWPALIKVLLQTDATNTQQAQQRLTKFASQVYDWTSQMQEGGPTPSSTGSPDQVDRPAPEPSESANAP